MLEAMRFRVHNSGLGDSTILAFAFGTNTVETVGCRYGLKLKGFSRALQQNEAARQALKELSIEMLSDRAAKPHQRLALVIITTMYAVHSKNSLEEKTNEFLDQPIQVQTMGKFSLPFVWATALTFTKSEFAKAVFDQVKVIEQNYAYFCSLYNVKPTNYRNDYAFAMALNAVSGYTSDQRRFIPWHLMSFATEIKQLQLQGTNIIVRNSNKAFVVSQQSLHFISKRYLQTTEFENFVSEVIDA